MNRDLHCFSDSLKAIGSCIIGAKLGNYSNTWKSKGKNDVTDSGLAVV